MINVLAKENVLSLRYKQSCSSNCYLFVCDYLESFSKGKFKRPFSTLPDKREAWGPICTSYFDKKKNYSYPFEKAVIVMKIKGNIHLGIYEGHNTMIHVTLDRPIRDNYSRYEKYVIGVYKL